MRININSKAKYLAWGFCALIVSMVGVKTYLKMENLSKTIEAQAKQLKDLTEQNAQANLEFSKLKGNVEVLDTAINSDKKRKARIDKVTRVIVNEIASSGSVEAKALNPYELSKMSAAIVDNADEYHIPVPLFLGLIRVESAFNPKAVSVDGAQGLTQIMPTTADDIKGWLGRTWYEPFDISHNIKFGAYYLNRMLRKFSYDYTDAVWAYNCGPERVAKHLQDSNTKLWAETIQYEKDIMVYKKIYESLGIN